jgi:hypothetical protein
LLNSWNTVNEVKRAASPGAPVTVTYSEYFSFLINQSKTHDLSTPFKNKKTRHAHRANFDFGDDHDGENHDDDSVLEEVIAHMSIQDEPMSEETVNALQLFSTFQRRRNNGPARARDPEAEIPHPLYSEVSKELCIAWSREDSKIKKRILQCKQPASKPGAKKNAELGVYMIESDDYASESDASAYSEATYGYDADDADDDSGDAPGGEETDLVVNAASSRQRRPPTGGILKKGKDLPRKKRASTCRSKTFSC